MNHVVERGLRIEIESRSRSQFAPSPRPCVARAARATSSRTCATRMDFGSSLSHVPHPSCPRRHHPDHVDPCFDALAASDFGLCRYETTLRPAGTRCDGLTVRDTIPAVSRPSTRGSCVKPISTTAARAAMGIGPSPLAKPRCRLLLRVARPGWRSGHEVSRGARATRKVVRRSSLRFGGGHQERAAACHRRRACPVGFVMWSGRSP